MAVSYNNAVDYLIGQLTDNELERFSESKAFASEMVNRALEIVFRSRVEDLWNRTSMEQRETILASLLSGPQRKTTAFALAGKKFSECPDYIKNALCEFIKRSQSKP